MRLPWKFRCAYGRRDRLPVPQRSARLPNFTRRSSCRGDITFQCVIHDHSIGIEAPTQRTDGALHALDPSSRKPVAVPLIVEWNQFVAEDAVEIFAVTAIMHIQVGVCPVSAYRGTE